VTLREQVEEYRRRMAVFNEWEAAQAPVERSTAAMIADLGFLLTWVPPEERLRDPDPEKAGIQRMRAGLAHLRGGK
jgi:hypothetical protein